MNEQQFRKIALAFMNVFPGIQCTTVSTKNKLEFWKTRDLRLCEDGNYVQNNNFRFNYKKGMVCCIPISCVSIRDAYGNWIVDRKSLNLSNFPCLPVGCNSISLIKNRFKFIAKELDLKSIEIRNYNYYIAHTKDDYRIELKFRDCGYRFGFRGKIDFD